MSNTLYLLNAFDYQTKEFVPLGIVTEDMRNKIIKNKPWTSRYFLRYHVDELDWKTINDYKFKIEKGDML